MTKSVAIPTGGGLQADDIVKELTDRITGTSVLNPDGIPVYTLEAKKASHNTIEIEMSDDSKFVIEVKSKN